MATRTAQLPTQLNVPRPVGGALAEGAAVSDAAPAVVDVAIYGAGRARLYGLIGADGTLSISALRWDGQDVYATPPIAAVTVTDGVEFVATIPLIGERGLRLTFTADAAESGVVSYLDVSAALGVGSSGGGGGGGVQSVVAGTGISVDNTDPANPVVSASGGGGGGGGSVELGGLLIPDTSGEVWWQPASILDTNDLVPGAQVLCFDHDGSALVRAGAWGPVPAGLAGTVTITVWWKTLGTSGDAVLTCQVVHREPGDSGDPSAWDESLASQDPAGSANELFATVFTPDASAWVPGAMLGVAIGRDLSDADDDLAAVVQVVRVVLEWAGA